MPIHTRHGHMSMTLILGADVLGGFHYCGWQKLVVVRVEGDVSEELERPTLLPHDDSLPPHDLLLILHFHLLTVADALRQTPFVPRHHLGRGRHLAFDPTQADRETTIATTTRAARRSWTSGAAATTKPLPCLTRTPKRRNLAMLSCFWLCPVCVWWNVSLVCFSLAEKQKLWERWHMCSSRSHAGNTEFLPNMFHLSIWCFANGGKFALNLVVFRHMHKDYTDYAQWNRVKPCR